MTSSDQNLPPIHLCNRWVVAGGTRGGNVFFHWLSSSSKLHHSLYLSSFHLLLWLKLLQLDAGVIKVYTDLALEWLPCHQSTLKRKKKKKLLSKQEYPHQADPQPNWGWVSSSMHWRFWLKPHWTFLNLLMVSQKLRWKHGKNRSNLSSLGVPSSTAKLLQGNHSAFALRTVEEQICLQLQQAEFQDRRQGSLCREKSHLLPWGKR